MSIFLLSLLACPGSKESVAPDDSTPADDSTATDDSGSGNPAEAPEVKSFDYVDCVEQQSAGEVWTIMATVDDPQGEDTIRTGSMDVLSGGQVLATYEAACNSGSCIVSFRSSYDNIGCDKVGEVVLRMTVTDLEGNVSEPFEYQTE